MKIGRFVLKIFPLLLIFCLCSEVSAVRPPLKPLGMQSLEKMVAASDLIAVGTVSSETRSKTVEKPRETITIRVVVSVDEVIKGERSIKTITIEESFRQFSSGDELSEKGLSASTAGPAPPVGVYRQGERIFMFLKSINNSGLFRPLGSGNYDAYLGLLRITSTGISSDRYMFDDVVSAYARSEDDFVSLITRIAARSSEGR